jgi:hypothetical protein
MNPKTSENSACPRIVMTGGSSSASFMSSGWSTS